MRKGGYRAFRIIQDQGNHQRNEGDMGTSVEVKIFMIVKSAKTKAKNHEKKCKDMSSGHPRRRDVSGKYEDIKAQM